MTVYDIFKYQLAMFMYKCVNSLLPQNISFNFIGKWYLLCMIIQLVLVLICILFIAEQNAAGLLSKSKVLSYGTHSQKVSKKFPL